MAKKEKPEEERNESNAIAEVSFKLDTKGNVLVDTRWGEPANHDDAILIVRGIAQLIYLCNSGKLLAPIQQSIGAFSHDNKVDADIAKAILSQLNILIQNDGGSSNLDKPVVSPRKCFQVRGEE